jgi:hypothetical protein
MTEWGAASDQPLFFPSHLPILNPHLHMAGKELACLAGFMASQTPAARRRRERNHLHHALRGRRNRHPPVIFQQSVPILSGDPAEELDSRIQALEHELYPAARLSAMRWRTVWIECRSALEKSAQVDFKVELLWEL